MKLPVTGGLSSNEDCVDGSFNNSLYAVGTGNTQMGPAENVLLSVLLFCFRKPAGVSENNENKIVLKFPATKVALRSWRAICSDT